MIALWTNFWNEKIIWQLFNVRFIQILIHLQGYMHNFTEIYKIFCIEETKNYFLKIVEIWVDSYHLRTCPRIVLDA